MDVRELNREQLEELKVNYYAERHEDMSYDDIVNINNLVSDEKVFKAYAGMVFTEEDFWLSLDSKEE